MDAPSISFVVPVKNEQDTLTELAAKIDASVTALGRSYEIIFIDDGSDDDSWEVTRSLVANGEGRIRGIRFRRNLGKAAALAAGFKAARGRVVFTMDADLQDDPKEIERFLTKLDEGYDIVSGWKRTRHDPWHKVLPSRVFNAMLSKLAKTHLHDHNCGFKCYRARVVKELALYGEMHRMLPALGTIRGFKSAEIEVEHHPRRFGRSKYGIERFLRGFMDMLTVAFLQNFRERPLHLMGGMAVMAGGLGAFVIALHLIPVAEGPLATVMAIVGGCLIASFLPLVALGFVAELLVNSMTSLRPSLPIAEELPSRRDHMDELASRRDASLTPIADGRPRDLPSERGLAFPLAANGRPSY